MRLQTRETLIALAACAAVILVVGWFVGRIVDEVEQRETEREEMENRCPRTRFGQPNPACAVPAQKTISRTKMGLCGAVGQKRARNTLYYKDIIRLVIAPRLHYYSRYVQAPRQTSSGTQHAHRRATLHGAQKSRVFKSAAANGPLYGRTSG